ncbi:mesoderm posterior protein 1-like [Rhinatrema bivittatum]|uniref:mesoderm posterior protein 1-like n=1 Tax=Rhinatrema bivittatum TaxID=194408 RepID=UPI001127EBDF|nr:mesoderm posterior protein 1-like [Rhinatrema bivittatum]
MHSSPAYLLPPDPALMQQWRFSDSDGYSSLSPASSTDSYGLSPPYPLYPTSPGTYYSVFGDQTQAAAPRSRAKPSSVQQGKRGRSRMACSQRQSASEREKLRMRDLSKALHNLRSYLPPSVVPAGQNLTKIETLRLTIRYISHLSDLLGLREETLTQRREAEIRMCDLCPEGLGCSQDKMHRLCPSSPARLESSLSSFQSSEPFQASPYYSCVFSHLRAFPLRPGGQAPAADPQLASPSCCEVRFHPGQCGAELLLPASSSLQKQGADSAALKLVPEEESPLPSPVSIDLGFFQVHQ